LKINSDERFFKTINIPQQQDLSNRKILHSEKVVNELIFEIYGLEKHEIEQMTNDK